ncbi:MAG: hypothetical protein ACK4HE_01970 [Chitinophagaceae bacterium]
MEESSAKRILRVNSIWYFLQMLTTALASVGTIIITKQQLQSDFIFFTLSIGAITFINNFTLCWLNQGINRFVFAYAQYLTIKNSILYAIASVLTLSLPIYIAWAWWVDMLYRVELPILFLLFHGIYSTVLAYTQATLRAKLAFLSEFIRSVTILFSFIFIYLANIKASNEFFWSFQILSVILATILIAWKNGFVNSPLKIHLNFQGFVSKMSSDIRLRVVLRNMFNFGLPLTIWSFVSFCLLNIDRWYMLREEAINKTSLADYTALYDLIFRGVGFSFAPFVASSFPIIVRLYDSGNKIGARNTIIRVLLIQTLLLIAGIIGFYFLHDIMFELLHFDESSKSAFLYVGILLIVLIVLWQMSAMLQKPLELAFRTKHMLIMLSIAAILTTACFYIVRPTSIENAVMCFAVGIIFYFLFTFSNLMRFKH